MQDKADTNQGITDFTQNVDQSVSSAALLESVSAMMDDEASSMELRRIVKAAPHNSEVAAVWQRYHLIRASLQQEAHSRPEVNLLAGINARLAEEQSLTRPALPLGRKIGGFFRKTGQIAVAASVAFTVLYSASYMEAALQKSSDGSLGSSNTNTVAASDNNTGSTLASDLPELGGSFTPSELTRTVSMDAATRNRIQRAVYQFSESQQVPFGQAYTPPEASTPEQLPAQP